MHYKIRVNVYKLSERGVVGSCETYCCIRCGPDEERILDIVPREDGARNSG